MIDKEKYGFDGTKILLRKLRAYQRDKSQDPRITYGDMCDELGISRDYSRIVESFFPHSNDVSNEKFGCIFTTLLVNSDTNLPGDGYFEWHFPGVKDEGRRMEKWIEQFNRLTNGDIDWDKVDDSEFK